MNNCCNIRNEENEYQYVLDELKKIQNDLDRVVRIVENRIEKDKVIDDCLTCECEDKKTNYDKELEEFNKRLQFIQDMMEADKRIRNSTALNKKYPTYYWF